MKKIENADNYVLTDDGIVYSLVSKKPVRKHWSPRAGREWSRVINNQGQRVVIYLDSPTASASSAPPEEMSPIDGFSSYRITSYGAVWRVSDGRNRKPTPLRVYTRGDHDYVQMIDDTGKRKTVNVQKLLSPLCG